MGALRLLLSVQSASLRLSTEAKSLARTGMTVMGQELLRSALSPFLRELQ